jgi:hypothetical protein
MDEAAVDTWDCTSALMESQSGSASGAPRASWRRCGVLADDGRGLRAQHASGVSLLRAVLAEHVGIADDGRRVRPGVDDFNPSSQRQHALDQAAIMAQWLRGLSGVAGINRHRDQVVVVSVCLRRSPGLVRSRRSESEADHRGSQRKRAA